MAGDEGFEPPMTGPEPVALPLGQSPLKTCVDSLTCNCVLFLRLFRHSMNGARDLR